MLIPERVQNLNVFPDIEHRRHFLISSRNDFLPLNGQEVESDWEPTWSPCAGVWGQRLTRPGPYTQIEKKLEPLSQDEDQHADLTQSRRPLTGCTIFLGYTSNLISSGIRETIRYLVQHNMVGI